MAQTKINGDQISLDASDITTALTYTPVNKAGDTMSGALTVQTTNNQIQATSGVYTTVVGASGGVSYVGSFGNTPTLLLVNNAEVARATTVGLQVGVPTADGQVFLTKGTGSFAGKVDFYSSADVRVGSIGSTDATLQYYDALGGRSHIFNQAVSVTGNLTLNTAGNGLVVKTGTNARLGGAALVAGTVTVSNTSYSANTFVLLTRQTPGGGQGQLSVTGTPGVSFTILSTDNSETSTVAWFLVESF